MMNNSINTYKKKIIITSIIILSIVFAIINLSIYYYNNQYLEEKIKQENDSFALLITHLLDDSDEYVTLKYVEHYSHIHSVELEFRSDVLLFKSEGEVVDYVEYEITNGGTTYYLLIDNTDSETTILNFSYVIYLNVAILIIYLFTILVVYRFASKEIGIITNDISLVLNQINKEGIIKESDFFFEEFCNISTTLKKSLEQIDYLKDKKEIKLKGLVHDLKTHLTIIYSRIELIDSKKVIKEEIINDLNNQINKINEIINDVILENVDKEIQEINLSKSLDEIIKQNISVFNSKNIKVDYEIEKDIIYEWNKRDFERVVNNILGNAYYYSNNDSNVCVKLYKESNKCILSVSDKGIGIKEEDFDKIFEKNYRAIGSKEYNSKGQGLGLYIVKLLVESINGDVYPVKQDSGVKIIIELPYTS